MAALRLVIFDCDGVLVDSERISNTIFCELLNGLGMQLTLEDMFERFVGLSVTQCEALIEEISGKPTPDFLIPEWRARTEAAFAQQVTVIPGVIDVLTALRVPYCVASNGPHSKMRVTLGATGLLPRFEGRMFSAADVQHPKPSPDVFLHAASKMGVTDAASCVVIEDTPAGVRAGIAAGMRTFGFAAHTPERRLREAGAHATFQQMSDLPGLLDAV
jgi:HAD superfamily hydrolase (TIGR01509 family)